MDYRPIQLPKPCWHPWISGCQTAPITLVGETLGRHKKKIRISLDLPVDLERTSDGIKR